MLFIARYKYIAASIFLLNTACTYTTNNFPLKIKQKIFGSSIPKCGTNLFRKCIHLLLSTSYKASIPETTISITKFAKIFGDPNNQFLLTHLIYTPILASYLNRPYISSFLVIRDPRDQIVSHAFYIIKRNPHRQFLLNNLISDLITPRSVSPFGKSTINATYTIVNFYSMYLRWSTLPWVCVIKFEDLVGPQGGGTPNLQYQTIRKIAHHINVWPDQQKINNVAQSLFGGTHTFRSGKIGEWKKYFTPEHKKRFKAVPSACQLLIDLGYEKDSNW